jgi:hypothetical protein
MLNFWFGYSKGSGSVGFSWSLNFGGFYQDSDLVGSSSVLNFIGFRRNRWMLSVEMLFKQLAFRFGFRFCWLFLNAEF